MWGGFVDCLILPLPASLDRLCKTALGWLVGTLLCLSVPSPGSFVRRPDVICIWGVPGYPWAGGNRQCPYRLCAEVTNNGLDLSIHQQPHFFPRQQPARTQSTGSLNNVVLTAEHTGGHRAHHPRPKVP
jgi:hypothetical protein